MWFDSLLDGIYAIIHPWWDTQSRSPSPLSTSTGVTLIRGKIEHTKQSNPSECGFLVLVDCPLSIAALPAIQAQLTGFSNVEQVSFVGMDFREINIYEILNVLETPSLQQLHFHGCQLTQLQQQAIETFSVLHRPMITTNVGANQAPPSLDTAGILRFSSQQPREPFDLDCGEGKEALLGYTQRRGFPRAPR